MTKTIVVTERFRVGAIYRREVMSWLDEFGVPYVEHRGLLDSIIVAKVYTEAHLIGFRNFSRRYNALVTHMKALDAEERREERQRKQDILDAKLARKNRWRKMTFRKPLTKLK